VAEGNGSNTNLRTDLSILDEIDDGYYEVDLDGRFTFVNSAFQKMVGLSSAQLIGLDNRAYMSEDTSRAVFAEFQQVFRTGAPLRVEEIEVALRGGPRFWVEFTVALRLNPEGAPVGFRGIVHDITSHKKIECAFQESNAKLLGLIQAIPHLVYFKDAARRIVISNEAFEWAVGLPKAEIIGKTDEEIFPPETAAASRKSDDDVLSSGRFFRFEETKMGRDGRKTVYETIKTPFLDAQGRIAGVVGVSRDITEGKRTEAALLESEERFRTLYENATVGLYRTTPDGRILLANPALLRMLGCRTIEELTIRNLEKEGFEPDYPRSAFKEKIERDGFIRGLEAAWKKQDGTTIFVRESARVISGPKGDPLYYEGTVEDITERKLAELEVQASEKKYRRLFENSLEGVYQSTPEGRHLAANPAMVRMFGYDSTSEFMNTSIRDLYADPRDRDEIIRIMETEDKIRNREIRLRRKDGTTFHALLNTVAIRNADGRIHHFEGMIADITDLVRSKTDLQIALQEREILLKEIHHRVKNNMQLISSLLNLQARHLKDSQAIEAFKDSQRRIRSMSLIHEKLYQSKSLSRIDFGNYIRNLTNTLIGSQVKHPGQILIRTNAEEINFDLKTAIPLGLIINELVSNALKHAFPDDRRGEIVIELRRIAENFLLSVRDDGIGFPKDIKIDQTEHLGLQLVNLLTQQLDGRLELIPSPGTEFRIHFREQNSASQT